MLKKRVFSVLLTAALMMGLVACGPVTIEVSESDNGAQLVALSLTPSNPTVAQNTDQQFIATGIYADNTTKDITAEVTWSSSDSNVATIETAAAGTIMAIGTSNSGAGRAYAKAVGQTKIKASAGDIAAESTMTVTSATLLSISITPAAPVMGIGTTQQFSAVGTFSDNTTQDLTASAAWTSSAPSVATINAAGLAVSVADGSATITAASGNISATVTLTVTPATLESISVSPADPSIAKGTKQQFSARGTYSDGSTQDITSTVVWSASDAGVAAMSASGLAAGSTVGSATISAALGSITGSTSLTVTDATLVSIAVTPASSSVNQGAAQQFVATGTYSDDSTQDLTAAAVWSSSNAGVATISNAAASKGLATGVAAGAATITAASGSLSATATLTVIAVVPTTATLSWNAPATYTDGAPLTVKGYKIRYGTTSGSYSATIDVGNVTTHVVTNLAPGTYYFTTTAYDASNVESDYSNEVSKTL